MSIWLGESALHPIGTAAGPDVFDADPLTDDVQSSTARRPR